MSPTDALLIVNRWWLPSWVSRVAAAATVRRLVRSAVALMPSLASAAPPLVTKLVQAPDWKMASSAVAVT
jgi:hypothetical protein